MEDREKKDQGSDGLKGPGTMFLIAGARIAFAYHHEGAKGVWKAIQDPFAMSGINPPTPKIIVKPRHVVFVDSTASGVAGHIEEASAETHSTSNTTSVAIEASRPSAAKLVLQTAWHGLGLLLFLFAVLAFPIQLARRIMKRRAG